MVAPRVERLSFDRFVEYVDLDLNVQLRELTDNVDIMDPRIDKESILLYRQQIEVLSFLIPPLVMDFFTRCGVSPLMINPCVLILLQVFATTNLALKGPHFPPCVIS